MERVDVPESFARSADRDQVNDYDGFAPCPPHYATAVRSSPASTPAPAARELFPDDFPGLSTKPCFLFFVVDVSPSATGSDDQPVDAPRP
jgi:hypothetical protein